jgi:5-methylcytosine-specific restriction endonuclease McrA
MTRAKYGSNGAKDAVWNRAKPLSGFNPQAVRQDPYGNKICYNSYGKNTSTGWSIDHIKPQSKGGSHDIRNLQALQHSTNISKSNSLVKKSRHNQ